MPEGSTHIVAMSLTAQRVAIALLLIVHGVTRIALGIVDDFGQFLETQHLPWGPGLAWVVTAVEIVGGTALVLGAGIRPLSVWFAAQLITGILLVHRDAGWFVVGAGRNGMEYSVLLIGTLAVTGITAPFQLRIGTKRGVRGRVAD